MHERGMHDAGLNGRFGESRVDGVREALKAVYHGDPTALPDCWIKSTAPLICFSQIEFTMENPHLMSLLMITFGYNTKPVTSLQSHL
jgi:hypothetical protein